MHDARARGEAAGMLIGASAAAWAVVAAAMATLGTWPLAGLAAVASVACGSIRALPAHVRIPSLLSAHGLACGAWVFVTKDTGAGFLVLVATIGPLSTGTRWLAWWLMLGLAPLAVLVEPSRALEHLIAVLTGTFVGLWASQVLTASAQEIRVQSETLRSQNDALSQSQAAIEQSLRVRSAFIANMSHEIRTPLNGVLAMARLLLDTRLDDAQVEMAQTIDRSGRSLLALLNDVLDWSKVDSGIVEIEEVRYGPREVAEEVVELFAGAAHEKGLEVALVASSEIPERVLGDAQRIRQILANLVGNALKFTETGGVLVRIHLADECLVFDVRDTGVGIAADQQASLFQPFVQAERSIRRTYGGTGLGLAVSREFARAMGGDVAMESAVGEGSVFTLTVPMASVDASLESTPPLPPIAGRRVLAIGVRPFSRQAIREALESMGAELADVESMEDAAEALSASLFDVVLIPTHLGDPAEMGRHLEMIDAPPAILLADLGAAGTAARAIELGFAGCAFAPIRRRDLCMCVDSAIRGEVDGASSHWSVFEDGLAERVPLAILVAEDNPTNQRVAELVLQRLGYRPAFAGDGEEAVEACQQTTYDLVLMDLQMPRKDGYQATQEILSALGDRAPAIVGFSASVSAEATQRCHEVGMRDVLSKPLDIEALVTVLRTLTGAGSGGSDMADVDPRATQALDMLLQLCGGDAAKRRGLVDDFVANAEQLVAAMHAALSESEAEDLRRAAHSLKGSSPMYGAPVLGERAAHLERHVRDHGLEGVEAGIEAVARQLEKTRGELARLLR